MDIYLVGGAVRDELLGLPVKERDYVVVGSSPEKLLSQGFKPVGKDFPVFLHPTTKEEYALARTEKKVAPGYTGFVFHADPSVTLEEDLLRRDLTINAIAKDKNGKLIDPYHGQQDLKEKILRHVSPAFSEDPVRILRLARFAARFDGFDVADETLILAQEMVKKGELSALTRERVWQELQSALGEKNPVRFFTVLEECEALETLFPALSKITNLEWESFKKSCEKNLSPIIRFAVLGSFMDDVSDFCAQWLVPNEYTDLARLVQEYLNSLSSSIIKTPEKLLDLFKKTDVYRRPERFKNALLAASLLKKPPLQSDSISFIQNLSDEIRLIKLDETQYQSLSGKEIHLALEEKRLNHLKTTLKNQGVL